MGVRKITLSYEMNYEKINSLINNYQLRYKKHPNLEVIISYKPEVMITKFDLNKYFNKEKLTLKGNNLYITKTHNNYMSIYLNKLFEDNNNYFNIGINNVRINKDF